MSPKLPRITPAEVEGVLRKRGFALVRQTGSHRIYRDAVNRRATVPYHAGKVLSPKVLSSIIADMGLTVEEFTQLL